MKKLILALAALGLSGSANAAPLVSENFESGFGAFTPTGQVDLANGAIYNPCCGTPNDTTNTFVAFGGGNLPSGTIATSFITLLGQLYTVAFDYKAFGGGTEPLTLQAAGQTYTVNPVADASLTFLTDNFTFTGTGGLTTLTVFSGGVANVDAAVDNITVSAAVPEPTTWAMMLIGFGAIGFGLRRRKAAGSTTRVQYNFA